jgi:hypothetical protein
MVNDENDEMTLHLGSEDEGFKSCQSDVPTKSEENEHPDMIGTRKVWMKIKAHEYVEAMKKATQEDVQIWILGKTKKLTIECLR